MAPSDFFFVLSFGWLKGPMRGFQDGMGMAGAIRQREALWLTFGYVVKRDREGNK